MFKWLKKIFKKDKKPQIFLSVEVTKIKPRKHSYRTSWFNGFGKRF